MGAHLVLENLRRFHSQQNRRVRRVPAKVAEKLPALDPVPPVAVIVAVIARNVGEVVRMTLLALRESRRSLMLLGRGASRTLARGSPVL